MAMVNLRTTALLLLTLNLAACVSASEPANSVYFESGNERETVRVRASLDLPDGDGPFPSVVLLHGCTGLERDAHSIALRGIERHASLLRENGFATLIVDSHGSRGIRASQAWSGTCKNGSQIEARIEDAYAALGYLEGLPIIQKGRVSAVGFSEGGIVAMRSAQRFVGRSYSGKFAAIVAYYPNCGLPYMYTQYYAPILVLIGERDDITLASSCPYLANKNAQAIESGIDTAPIDVVVYSGAYHSFDLPLRGQQQVPIGTVAPNRPAFIDSQRQMVQFLLREIER